MKEWINERFLQTYDVNFGGARAVGRKCSSIPWYVCEKIYQFQYLWISVSYHVCAFKLCNNLKFSFCIFIDGKKMSSQEFWSPNWMKNVSADFFCTSCQMLIHNNSSTITCALKVSKCSYDYLQCEHSLLSPTPRGVDTRPIRGSKAITS